MVGKEVFEVEEGGWYLRPHGTVLTFWKAGNDPAIFIDFYPNQNLEVFLEELHQLFSQLSKEGMSPNSKEGRKRQDDYKQNGALLCITTISEHL